MSAATAFLFLLQVAVVWAQTPVPTFQCFNCVKDADGNPRKIKASMQMSAAWKADCDTPCPVFLAFEMDFFAFSV